MAKMSDLLSVIRDARERGLEISLTDVEIDECGEFIIDGMPADEWIHAMTEE